MDMDGRAGDMIGSVVDMVGRAGDMIGSVVDMVGRARDMIGHARSHFLRIEKTCKNNAGFS